jgi:hypothetical protein
MPSRTLIPSKSANSSCSGRFSPGAACLRNGRSWPSSRVGAVYGMMFMWMPLLAIALKYFMVNEIGRWSIATVIIGLSVFPPFRELLKGFAFMIPSVTPDWAAQYKIAKNPLVEILPAMALSGCGAVNSLWYSDWTLSKGLGLGQYFDGLENSRVAVSDLKHLDRGTIENVKGWYRVMFKDNLWGGNFLTILVTFFYLLLAVVILHPMQQAPAGPKSIIKPKLIFTLGTIAAGALYAFLILVLLIR